LTATRARAASAWFWIPPARIHQSSTPQIRSMLRRTSSDSMISSTPLRRARRRQRLPNPLHPNQQLRRQLRNRLSSNSLAKARPQYFLLSKRLRQMRGRFLSRTTLRSGCGALFQAARLTTWRIGGVSLLLFLLGILLWFRGGYSSTCEYETAHLSVVRNAAAKPLARGWSRAPRTTCA